jgi:hypothetical protein
MANAMILQDFQLDKSPVTAISAGPEGSASLTQKMALEPDDRARK